MYVNPLAAVGTGAAFGGFGIPTAIVDSDSEVWGLGVVQHIDAASMELFLSYRNYSAEVTLLPGAGIPTFDYNDMDVVYSGARIRF